MKKLLLLSIASMLLISSGCKKNIYDVESKTIQLRVLNATPWAFTSCIVAPVGALTDAKYYGTYNFGEVATNTHTRYITFQELDHRNVLIKVVMNNKNYSLKTYDVLGATFLEQGTYAYKLTYKANSDELSVEVIVE